MNKCTLCDKNIYKNELCLKHYGDFNRYVRTERKKLVIGNRTVSLFIQNKECNFRDKTLRYDGKDYIVTSLQQHWLNIYGDRTVDDLRLSNNNLCIEEVQGRTMVLSKIPDHESLVNNMKDYFTGKYIRRNMK